MNRRIERALLSSNHTRKVSDKFTIAHFNWSVTTGLQSWAQSWPVVREYIASRIQTIPHWAPDSWCRIATKLRLTLQSFFGYQFKAHINHYDYRPVAEAFYLMYNPYVLGLMEGDVRFAPHYFAMLYDKAPLKNSSITSVNATSKQTKKTAQQQTQTTRRKRPCKQAASAA
jgi:hypothetical protein